jgi:NAD(P)-dependent dehydrogenase (short-subunit alcohol dehydrogenase family)
MTHAGVEPLREFAQQALDSAAVQDLQPTSLYSLAGRVALVTGAGGGVGGWLSAGLGSAGAAVALADVSLDATAATASLLDAAGIPCVQLAGDLADAATPTRLVAETVDRLGRLDVLVNNAAVNARHPAESVTPLEWDLITTVDLKAPYFLCTAAASAMRSAGGGSIVNIGSINVAIGLEDVSVYGAAKAGLAQLAKSLSVEWNRHGIRVNCLAPGFLLTPLSEPVWRDPVRRRWLLERSPLRRPGSPRELVGACVLLASDAGSFISGQTFFIDGGVLAGTPWSECSW